jgi:outer membrane protein TolC
MPEEASSERFRSDGDRGCLCGNFKNNQGRGLDFIKIFTHYKQLQSFLSFGLLPSKRGTFIRFMPVQFPISRLTLSLASFVTCLGMLSMPIGAYAQGKGPKLGGPVDKKEEKSSGGILKRLPRLPWLSKKDKSSAEQPEPTKIEDVENLTSTGEGAPEIELAQPELDSDLQWSPEDRSFDQSAPMSGMLGMKDLIELGLRNSEEVLRREREISIAEGNRDTVRDWKDPELRFSIGRDNDIELQRPYTTTERQLIDSQGRDVTDIFGRDLIKGNTTRERRIREEQGITERKITKEVTPGIDGTHTKETTETRSSDTRDESRSGSSTNSVGQSAPNRESSSEKTRSTSRETQRSFESNRADPTYPDSSFRIRVRFPIPNFLEMKQRLKQAKAEVGIAEIEHEAARRSLVRDIRNAYEKIEYLLALDSFDRQVLVHAEDFHQALVAQDEKYKGFEAEVAAAEANAPGLTNSKDSIDPDDFVDRVRPDELSTVRSEILTLQSQLDKNLREIQNEKIALAELAGIGDPERIAFTNSLVELDVELEKIDIGYLKSMAALKRPDLKELRLELEIAESQTAEEKAKRIPMFNFFDVDYGQSFDKGELSKDDFGAQIGMSIPLMSLFKNKAVAASKKESAARRREVERLTANLSNEVDLAVRSVGYAREYLLKTQEHVASAEANLKQTIESIQAEPKDASRLPEAKFEDLEVVIKARQEVVRALRDYNQEVRALEKAIGGDLESTFGKQVK